MAPFAKASTMAFGMISKKNCTVPPCDSAVFVKPDRAGVDAAWVDIHSHAGLHDIDDNKSNDEHAIVETTSK
jgi:hypothetical protein